MDDLLKKQVELMEKDIIICYFSVKQLDKILFRFYFKEMSGSYIYNPVLIPKEGKPHYEMYNSFEEGLSEMIIKANEYLNKKHNL